jgi:hypothetical protein
VRDAGNNFLTGVPVGFSATSGGIAVTTATTGANGEAMATLGTAGDPTNRSITVTATAGTQSATITVGVVGTTATLTGPSSLILGSTGTYTVTLLDSANAPIPGATVTVASAAGNTLSGTSLTTNAFGNATFTMTGSVSGNDTLTATVLGESATAPVSVSNQNFAFSAPAANTLIVLGVAQTVSLTWATGGTPQANQTITFATTRGTFNGGTGTSATAVTNSAGVASVTVSDSTAGPAIITASSAGVSAELPVTFIATDPSVIDLQASPTTVETSGSSTITAIVRDPAGNLVDGQTVAFNLTDVTGGSLSVGSAITNVQGQAQTIYTATTTSSTTNGVVVSASIPAAPTVPTATADLTVGGQTVNLSLGTGNTITPDSTNTQFQMPFIVQAVDSAGNAVNGVTVTLSIKTLQYAKGGWVVYNGAWVGTGDPQGAPYTMAPPGVTVCSLPPPTPAAGGLPPTTSVAAVSPGTVVTAPTTLADGTTINGGATLTVTYPQDHADWIQSELTATATVAGTQNITTSTFWLPMLAADLTQPTIEPPGLISPYGDDAADPPNFTVGTGGCLNPN